MSVSSPNDGVGDFRFRTRLYGLDAKIIIGIFFRLEAIGGHGPVVDLFIFAVKAGRCVDVIPIRIGIPPPDDRAPVTGVDPHFTRFQLLVGKLVAISARRERDHGERKQKRNKN